MRLLSQRGAIKSIAGVDTGSAADYWGIPAVNAYLNKNLAAAENIVFSIPGNPRPSRGIGAETFIDICQAYVKALKADELPTARQTRIAVGCSLFLAGCAKVGLLALIDEATGYQYDRGRAGDSARVRDAGGVMRNPPPPLTVQEQAHVRAALHYLHARIGSWAVVAKAVRSKRANLRRLRAGHRIRGMRRLAGRIARLAGIHVQALLTGGYPPPGTCPHCGHPPDGKA